MERKWLRKRASKKMLDLLMEQKKQNNSYEELKREAESRVGCRRPQWNLSRTKQTRKYFFSARDLRTLSLLIAVKLCLAISVGLYFII